jgi:hypothetical protein
MLITVVLYTLLDIINEEQVLIGRSNQSLEGEKQVEYIIWTQTVPHLLLKLLENPVLYLHSNLRHLLLHIVIHLWRHLARVSEDQLGEGVQRKRF